MTDVKFPHRFWDASAAAKLVVSEEGSDKARQYFDTGGLFYITPHCAVEVLSVLKAKHRRHELTHEQYRGACSAFMAHLRGRLKLDGPEIEAEYTFSGAEDLCRKYNLDVVDAIQLYTVQFLDDLYKGDSAPLLITADAALASAARAENLRVWDCLREPVPAD